MTSLSTSDRSEVTVGSEDHKANNTTPTQIVTYTIGPFETNLVQFSDAAKDFTKESPPIYEQAYPETEVHAPALEKTITIELGTDDNKTKRLNSRVQEFEGIYYAAQDAQSQYKVHKDRKYFKIAIMLYRRALSVQLPFAHPLKPMALCNLGTWLWTQYDQEKADCDLDEAIWCLKEAFLLWPDNDPNRIGASGNLAACLNSRYQKGGVMKDLDEAIEYLRRTLLHPGLERTHKSVTLGSLAYSLQQRYEKQGSIRDIKEAVQYHREELLLLPLEHPNQFFARVNLATCLELQHEKRVGTDDLEQAIQTYKEALELCPADNPRRSSVLNSLAHCLNIWHAERGSPNHLEEAIHHNREALRLGSLDDSSRAGFLNNLATSLWIRYEHQGSIQDLEEAVHRHREALSLPPGDFNRSGSLNNFAACLWAQFELQNHLPYLEEAIQCHREALQLRPEGDPERSLSLSNLASCIWVRYCHQNDRNDLIESIMYNRGALSLQPPGHSHRSLSLNNLAFCLKALYQNTIGGEIFLEEAIRCLREALLLRPEGHQYRPRSLVNLARCLKTQFKQNGNLERLEEAIQCLNESILLSSSNDPLYADRLGELASIYADNSELLAASHNVEYFSDLFEQATRHPTASLRGQFQLSLDWIKRQNGASGLRAYQRCLEVADHYLLIRSSITSRHKLLLSIPNTLALDATASAIEAEDIRRAVEFLEQGRTLLWSQMGRYRTPLNELQDVNPGLAAEFTRLSHLMETSATSSARGESPSQSMEMEQEAHKYRELTDSWKATLEKIHQVDGFDTFLKPPRYSMLQKCARKGPVIVVNISSRRCDAIIIQGDDNPTLVPLPHVQIHHLSDIANNFTTAITIDVACRSKVLAILRMLWDDIVKPVVEKLQELNVAPRSRIWWCPTSWLAMLPLHAAGPHRGNRLNLPDIYISSYTPTLSALSKSIQSETRTTGSSSHRHKIPRLLLVAQPETPSQVKIPSIWDELASVDESVASVDMLLNENGTRRTVLEGLKTHNWVHFTCHGVQHSGDPFGSCFHLHDKPLTLLDVVEAHLPDAQFAYLSACHSAAGDKETLDETIHLAAALQFSGFQSVIGTMYGMADIDGPTVAKEVYKHLFRRVGKGDQHVTAVVDHQDAAEALNIATKALKRNGVPLERWINFVHIGA